MPNKRPVMANRLDITTTALAHMPCPCGGWMTAGLGGWKCPTGHLHYDRRAEQFVTLPEGEAFFLALGGGDPPRVWWRGKGKHMTATDGATGSCGPLAAVIRVSALTPSELRDLRVRYGARLAAALESAGYHGGQER